MSSPYDDGWLLDQLAEEIRENERVRQAMLVHRDLKPSNMPRGATDDDAPTTRFTRVPPAAS